jgi:hypothetical protein
LQISALEYRPSPSGRGGTAPTRPLTPCECWCQQAFAIHKLIALWSPRLERCVTHVSTVGLVWPLPCGERQHSSARRNLLVYLICSWYLPATDVPPRVVPSTTAAAIFILVFHSMYLPATDVSSFHQLTQPLTHHFTHSRYLPATAVPPTSSNSENVELHAVFPLRLAHVGEESTTMSFDVARVT